MASVAQNFWGRCIGNHPTAAVSNIHRDPVQDASRDACRNGAPTQKLSFINEGIPKAIRILVSEILKVMQKQWPRRCVGRGIEQHDARSGSGTRADLSVG